MRYFCLIFGCAFFQAHVVRGDAGESYVDVGDPELRTLCGALNRRAEIYICRVTEKTARSEARDPIERGRVTAKVLRTLHGADRKVLDLPYAIRKPPNRPIMVWSDWLGIWPDAGIEAGKIMICVVIPGGYDPSAERTPVRQIYFPNLGDEPAEPQPAAPPARVRPALAACRVNIVADINSDLITQFEEVIRLHRLAGTDGFYGELERAAAADQRIEVFGYVAKTASTRIAAADSGRAIRIMEMLLRQPGMDGAGQKDYRLSWAMGSLETMARPQSPREVRLWAISTLCRMLHRREPDVFRQVVQTLCNVIVWRGGDGQAPIRAVELLSADERDALQRILMGVVGENKVHPVMEPELRRLSLWLSDEGVL